MAPASVLKTGWGLEQVPWEFDPLRLRVIKVTVPILKWAPTYDRRRIDRAGLQLPVRCPVLFPSSMFGSTRMLAGWAQELQETEEGVTAQLCLKDPAVEAAQAPGVELYPQVSVLDSAVFTDEDKYTVLRFGHLADVMLGLTPSWQLPSVSKLLRQQA